MKSLEVLKEEYLLHEFLVESSSEDILGYISSFDKTLEEDKLDCIKTIKINYFNKFLSKIKNILALEKDDLDYYDKDNEILNDEVEMALIYKYYLTVLRSVLNKENVNEVAKLFDYLVKNYEENLSFLENKRDVLNYERSFINFEEDVQDESVLSFQEFFKREIESISSIKPVEKVK